MWMELGLYNTRCKAETKHGGLFEPQSTKGMDIEKNKMTPEN